MKACGVSSLRKGNREALPVLKTMITSIINAAENKASLDIRAPRISDMVVSP